MEMRVPDKALRCGRRNARHTEPRCIVWCATRRRTRSSGQPQRSGAVARTWPKHREQRSEACSRLTTRFMAARGTSQGKVSTHARVAPKEDARTPIKHAGTMTLRRPTIMTPRTGSPRNRNEVMPHPKRRVTCPGSISRVSKTSCSTPPGAVGPAFHRSFRGADSRGRRSHPEIRGVFLRDRPNARSGPELRDPQPPPHQRLACSP